ncbi:aldo/keto reductase family domain-containing protein [Ditylenchus destructor]|uniref:Aldo/keto reductase family domain-containing protein n=1 Tax=Ditylenchus destructor TaxID=166010 RepID=A0AAD4MSK6_9BILA|nr:aldo/keto reductase family domain-containing protein [Ditylenchus destructor]
MAKHIQLSNGVQMPTLGLGTWQGTGNEVKDAVRIALKNGYRLFDTATVYGNEAEIGEVLQDFIASGKIKREDIFITTKLGWMFNRAEEVEVQLRESLSKLRLDYVDLYLIHVPVSFDRTHSHHDLAVKVTDIWKGMENVYEKKLTRAIGVSNFNSDQIDRIQRMAKVPIHNNQVELHLYFNQKALRAACQKHNISVTAYAPIGSPGRTDTPLPNNFSFKFGAAPNPLENETVLRLAKKYNKTPAQILLRHLVQLGISVIPKSTNEKRIVENSQIFDFNLSNGEIQELDNAPQAPRIFKLEFMAGHPEDSIADERAQQ